MLKLAVRIVTIWLQNFHVYFEEEEEEEEEEKKKKKKKKKRSLRGHVMWWHWRGKKKLLRIDIQRRVFLSY